MANTDSNSNKQTNENTAIHKAGNLSTLHCIISNAHLLHQTGYDDKNHIVTYVGDAKDLAYLEGAADASITTIAFGISAIGKLMASQDKTMGCDDNDISALGWLLNDLGASIVALQNIQSQANDAVAYAKKLS